ncbi:hypothetical protein [Fulvivirga lutea]|uniref:Lipocalin-like domain-containing protein n=1 Tax=Fulvivirga lutea TaxID=2810512 RepID=A0A974WE64_9BACT|nr:hypothetical protein [Fulvivirga lutea]QSE96613.1 hypothetical protein JR347_13545 [Fulvivirga lutea]
MNRIISIILITILFACESKKSSENEEKAPEQTLSQQMVGTWRNLELKVTIKNNSKDSVLNVPEGKWPEILNINPIETSFNEDGTFVSVYKDIGGNVIMSTNGTWGAIGDTLKMTKSNLTNSYHAQINEDIVTFKSYLDWDNDGERDDYYEGTQEKISTEESL